MRGLGVWGSDHVSTPTKDMAAFILALSRLKGRSSSTQIHSIPFELYKDHDTDHEFVEVSRTIFLGYIPGQ